MGYQKPVISEHWFKNRNVMTVFKDGIAFKLISNIVKPFAAWQTFEVNKSNSTDTAFYFTSMYVGSDINTSNFK